VPRRHLATEALKLAALPPSGVDSERIFSQARAAFDYFMGKLKVETLSDRVFVRIHEKVLARMRFRNGQAVPGTGGLKTAPA
jgi:hypothetical protein